MSRNPLEKCKKMDHLSIWCVGIPTHQEMRWSGEWIFRGSNHEVFYNGGYTRRMYARSIFDSVICGRIKIVNPFRRKFDSLPLNNIKLEIKRLTAALL